MNIIFNIKCTLCGNEKDSEFYTMPVEETVKDGKVFSFTKFDIVCKNCNQKHILTLEMKQV